MLYYKHLSPYLLIYLIVTTFLFFSQIGIIVILNINQINGINFTGHAILFCPSYTYLKLQTNTSIILKICFIFSIISTIFALGQLIFIIYQFIKFKKFADQNDQDQFTPFKQLTFKKLVLLYFLNTGGLLSLIVLFGSYLAFYIQFNKCQQQSNFSSSYLIPWIIGGVALLTQLILFILTMKFFYHYREEEIKQEAAREAAMTKKQRELKEMQDVKKRILDSRKNNPNKQYYQDSTDQQTPRDIDTNLLDKMQSDAYKGRQNSIYDGSINKQGQQLNVSQMSPNSISAKQKQLLKTLPKHPFKQYKIDSKFNPNDVIFQENYSLEDGSIDQNYQFKDPHNNSKLQHQTQKPYPQNPNFQQSNYLNFKETKNSKLQSPKNTKLQSPKNTKLQSPKNTNVYPQNNLDSGNKQNQKLSISQIFRQRYMNSPYLKDLQDKNISPQERRKIKKPFLKLSSGIIQLDGQKDFINNSKQPLIQQSNKQKITKNNSPNKVHLNVKPSKQPSFTPQSNKSSKSRSTAYYIEKSLKQGRKIQNQNPIANYVNDDQVHEDHLNRIIDFQKISKRRRRTFASNPFFPLDNKEDSGKLYLHKNKHDNSGNTKNNPLDIDQQDQGFDPFRDEAYDDQMVIYRGLLTDDQGLRSSGSKNINKIDIKKSNSKDLQTPVQTKKSSRKDAQLLDFIRSKHVID